MLGLPVTVLRDAITCRSVNRQAGYGNRHDGEVLLRLVYRSVTNTFAVLRSLPISDRDKDAEILALRHQITVLRRHLGPRTVTFTPAERAFLAAVLQPCPVRSCAGYDCSSDRTRCCAGTAT